MTKFSTFNLPDILNNSLKRMEYETATPIQAKAIPFAMEGRDVLGSAQTGTGKTAAFSIPLINHLVNNPNETGIVLTPTRELAVQVIDIVRQLIGPKKSIHAALLIGGAPMHAQIKDLKRRPRIIVGTPGRINDHLGRGRLQLDRASFLILDETDRMLDMGFGVQIDEILSHMPQKRQTLLFSATLPKAIQRVASKYLTNPERVAIGSTTDVAKNVTQEMIRVSTSDKYDMLLSQVEKRKGSIIIFVKTKRGADKMAERLCNEDFRANAIHGDLRQRQRDRVIKQFREKKYRILVATDVAARGLDIPHIEHVINYNLPQCPEDYIHRIGRTARAGAKGEALCIVSPEENSKWNAISRMLDPNTSDDGGQEQNRRKRGNGRKPYSRKSGNGANGNRDFSRGRDTGPRGGYKGKKSFGDRNDRRRDDDRSENRSGNGDRKRSFGGKPSRGNSERAPRWSDQMRDHAAKSNGGSDRNNRSGERKYVENRGERKTDDRKGSSGYQENRGKGQRKFGQDRLDGKSNFDAGKRRREEGRRARDGEERSHGKKRDYNPSRSENRGNSNGGRGRDFNKNNRSGESRGSGSSEKRSYSGGRSRDGSQQGGYKAKKPFGGNRSRNNRDGNKPVRRRNAA